MDHAMSFEAPQGDLRVVPRDAAASFWQPQPANGYAEVILAAKELDAVHRFSMGRQLLPPGGTVRPHAHDRAEEVLYILTGSGRAEIDGATYRLDPGTTLYLGHNRPHTFHNDGDVDLQWVWFFLPGGLEDFFAAIGPARKPGEPTPAPFARPADVREIERRTVFAKRPESG